MKFSHTMDFQFFMHDYEFFTHVINSEESFYHNHNFVEITYILEGTCKQHINGSNELLKEGDMQFLRPMDTHAFIETAKYPSRHRDILFSNKLFKSACDFISPTLHESFLHEKSHIKIHLTLEKIKEIEEDIAKLNFIINKDNEHKNAIPLLRVFCCKLLGLMITPTDLPGKKAPAWLLELIDKLNNGVDILVPLSTLLADYHYDVTYMRKTFKQYTGLSMTDYRLNVQLKYAATLLKTTNRSVKEIASMAGFNNYPYFNKAFKKKYNVTPLKSRFEI